jgi:hypothetical protein
MSVRNAKYTINISNKSIELAWDRNTNDGNSVILEYSLEATYERSATRVFSNKGDIYKLAVPWAYSS